MKKHRNLSGKGKVSLIEKYPSSDPCGCDICKAYCKRPGWWTVCEASKAIESGYGRRMMLEFSPDFSFGVLSPAFRGCEGYYAIREFSGGGCCFLNNGLCELHGTGFQPLECRFCHHSRMGAGMRCHEEIGRDWNTPAGREIVQKWVRDSSLQNLILPNPKHIK
jgi:hypothetical protein